MEDPLRFDALIEKFAKIKEKYGDDYPIILYEPAIKCQEKNILMNLIEGNSSINLFTEFREAFKFLQSLNISFTLIVSKDLEEEYVLHNFESLKNTFGRVMFDFEEEAFLKSVFAGISDELIKSLNFKVYVFCTFFDCLTRAEIKEDEEEVLLMCDIKEIVNQFRQEFTVIWYDPSVSAERKANLEKQIEVDIEEKNIYTNFQELLMRIKDENTIPYHLILSGGIQYEAQELVKDIENLKSLLGLYIVCDQVQIGKNEIIDIDKSLEGLFPKIKEGIRTRSKLKNTFPAFATNFDSSDRSGIYQLHFYLKSLVNFHNRKQAKGDFIKLARRIYQDQDKRLTHFEERYTEYNKAEILEWYTKDSPIYRLINNCLRISSSDSILYCRFVLKDLERAIREQYQEKSKNFSGIVYRGTFISKDEWEKLEKNIGEEIEMYGFLSTSVKRKTAVNFLEADLNNKVFIKIIVPALPELDEQGFADISEFSYLKGEKEILFNVRSRFRILEAGVTIDSHGTTRRHLVLLYGAHSLRRYMTKTQPSIEIKLELPPEIKCNLCGSQEKLLGFKQQEETAVNCLECLIKVSFPKDTPMIVLDGEDNKSIMKTFKGKVLKSQKAFSFSNSGYKCHDCGAKGKDNYYKWMSCHEKRVLVQCLECLQKKKTIKNEILLSENSPFAMWQEQQEEWEKINQEYQGLLLQITDENQGRVEIEVQNYDRSIEYAKKVIDKFKHCRRREMFKAFRFKILAQAFLNSGKYHQALKYFKYYQNILTFLGIERSVDGVSIYCKIAGIHDNLAEHQTALKYFQQALKIQMSDFGENHEGILAIYSGLASLYDHLGEYQNAFEYFTKAISTQKSLGGENHSDIAVIYSNFAYLYRKLGSYKEALEYSNLSHHILKSVYGEKHHNTAASYNNMASIQKASGNYRTALEHYQNSLDIQKQILPEHHPSIAAVYHNLGSLCDALGDYQKALECYSKTLDIQKFVYKEKHPEIAKTYANMGLACHHLGDHLKAIELCNQAIDILQSIYGAESHEIAVSYNILAQAYKSLGENSKVFEYYKKALDLYISIYGEDHPDTLTISYNLGEAYGDLGKYEEALELCKKVLNKRIATFGEIHLDTAASYSRLASVYAKFDKYEIAKEYFLKALSIEKSINPENHPQVASSYHKLAEVHYYLKNFQQAVDYFSKAIDMRKSTYGEKHPETASSYDSLGMAYCGLRKYHKALGYHTKSLEIRKSIYKENHPAIATSYNNIGLLYQAWKFYQKAKESLRKALDIFEPLYGDQHPLTVASYEHLLSVCTITKDYEEVTECLKKLRLNKNQK